ncbi:MAG TPA: phosphatidate cytidylyltransferase, partial [Rhodospirillaceae bacterium]|nr:phosphatidate cytidylyltransferase [Rhodospirillaceae bacterium]
MMWEWLVMARAQMLWLIVGSAYILAAAYVLFLMRGDGDAGRSLILFLFVVTWMTDTGAYLTGRSLGGPKLAPRISPSKTISGAIGGLLAGVGAGILIWYLTGGGIDGQVAIAAVVG